ncbi:DUF2341 domain-containing protein [Durusdinium trenchii]
MKLIILVVHLILTLGAKYRSIPDTHLAAVNTTKVESDVAETQAADEESDSDSDVATVDEQSDDASEQSESDSVSDASDASETDSGDVDTDANMRNVSFLEMSMKETRIQNIVGVGNVLVRDDVKEGVWVLLMKLSKNEFCHNSPRWTDGKGFNEDKMLDENLPNHKEYDAKSIAFHTLNGIDTIKLQTDSAAFDEAPEVHFKHEGTAEKLITTNEIAILGTGDFNTKKYWQRWSKAFKNSRNLAPAFMRADKFVRDPAPECRTNPTDNPSGCGKACVFCMQAADGDACPAKSKHNDISKGIGLSQAFCGGGDRNDCSSSGSWAGDSRTLVWGHLRSAKSPYKIYEMDDGGDVFVKESDGESWALVMKLSKNDFCHGSPRWTDQHAFHADKMLDASMPKHMEYDAKSKMFHTLKTTAIKLQTNKKMFEDAVEVHFEEEGTPETLITTNQIKIKAKGGFNTKKYWKKWEAQYGNSRQLAPAFMRADKFVLDPAPECRKNPEKGPSGCGKACVFCFQAADGNGCPAHVKHNDISVGIGLSQNFCGGGNKQDCSSSGNWVGDAQTLVWAKWSCKKHPSGACAGARHMGSCGELEPDDCDTHYVKVKADDGTEAYLQCRTVGGQCVHTGPPCFGTCL